MTAHKSRLFRRSPFVLLAAAGLLSLAGCGGSENLADVQGDVWFYGRPCSAEVVAQPVDAQGQPTGRPSTGVTDAAGHFRLSYTAQQAGALIGAHQVTVTVHPFEFAPETLSFQAKTKSVKTIRLTRRVDAGENDWEFWMTY